MTDIMEALDAARSWTPTAGVEVTATDRIRSAFFQGESLTGDEAAARFLCTSSMLGTAVKTLKTLGFTFAETPEERESGSGRPKTRFRMTNPNHRPTAEQLEALRAKGRKKAKTTKETKEREAKVTPVEPEPTPVPMPTFGAFVEIYSMHTNGDGKVTIGLRDEATAWHVTLVSGAPR